MAILSSLKYHDLGKTNTILRFNVYIGYAVH